jgi:hypothetical protein
VSGATPKPGWTSTSLLRGSLEDTMFWVVERLIMIDSAYVKLIDPKEYPLE